MSRQPVILTENLQGESRSTGSMEIQLGRWEKAGKLLQLKRGVYVFAEPYRRSAAPLPAYVAALIKSPSYISLEKALEIHGLIPEAVPTITSVTTKATSEFRTPLGLFKYRHILQSLFWGYELAQQGVQSGFIAHPEKCLLDLIYLNHITVTQDYLEGLRLQNTAQLKMGRLTEYAGRFQKPSILAAVAEIRTYIRNNKRGEKKL